MVAKLSFNALRREKKKKGIFVSLQFLKIFIFLLFSFKIFFFGKKSLLAQPSNRKKILTQFFSFLCVCVKVILQSTTYLPIYKTCLLCLAGCSCFFAECGIICCRRPLEHAHAVYSILIYTLFLRTFGFHV